MVSRRLIRRDAPSIQPAARAAKRQSRLVECFLCSTEISMQRWLLLSGLMVAVLTSFPAHSQYLRDALEGAWGRQPAARATGAREDELAARRNAAAALFPEPPSVNLGYRTDRFNQNAGTRELEGVISLPVWTPGIRDAAQSLAQAESEQFDSGLRAQRWRLAGEVREAYWQARLAATELELAQRKVDGGGGARRRCRATTEGRRSGSDRSQSGSCRRAARPGSAVRRLARAPIEVHRRFSC